MPVVLLAHRVRWYLLVLLFFTRADDIQSRPPGTHTLNMPLTTITGAEVRRLGVLCAMCCGILLQAQALDGRGASRLRLPPL